jgi:CelD/BcsL family acetyltransferase involved in cellulose biosynthesis
VAQTGVASLMAGCLRCHGYASLIDRHLPARLFLVPDAATARGEEPWLDGVTPRMRRGLRKSTRRVVADFGVEPEFEVIDAADPDALARFFDLEASGWKGREGTAIKCSADTLTFYNDMAVAVARDGALRLHFLRIRGVPVAGSLSVVSATRLHVLKAGYAEEYATYQPGQMLLGAMLRDCMGQGMREMDIGDDAPHKRTWTSTIENHEFLYVFNRTLYGRLLYVYRAALRPALGRLFRRWHRSPKPKPAPEVEAD